MAEDRIIKVKVETPKGQRVIEYKEVPIDNENENENLCETKCPYGELCMQDKIKNPTNLESSCGFMEFCQEVDTKTDIIDKDGDVDFNCCVLVEGTLEKNLGDIITINSDEKPKIVNKAVDMKLWLDFKEIPCVTKGYNNHKVNCSLCSYGDLMKCKDILIGPDTLKSVCKSAEFNDEYKEYVLADGELERLIQSGIARERYPIGCTIKLPINTLEGIKSIEYVKVKIDYEEENLCDTKCPYKNGLCEKLKNPIDLENKDSCFMVFCQESSMATSTSINMNDFVPVAGTIEKNLGDILKED